MSAHTPGPWKISPEGYIGAGEYGNNPVVAKIAQFFGPGDRERFEADRHLIAAAPALLKAAKRALNILKAQGESVLAGNVLGALDAAIKQAEGRS